MWAEPYSQGVVMALALLSFDCFHQESWKVIFVDISGAKGKAKAEDTPGLVFVEGDVTKRETWEDVLNLAVNQFGRLDVVVNNAGK